MLLAGKSDTGAGAHAPLRDLASMAHVLTCFSIECCARGGTRDMPHGCARLHPW